MMVVTTVLWGSSPCCFQVPPADVEDVVAGDDAALFIHGKAAVGIAVVGKAHIQLVGQHKAAQSLDVGGAHAVVDVEAIGSSPMT